MPSAFKQAESDTLPVIDSSGRLVGIISEYDLAKVLPEWGLEKESYKHNITVSQLMTREVWTEEESANVSDLLSNVHKMHTRVVPIVDKAGIYTGRSITRTSLVAYLTRMVKPLSIGGLSTPLGVYMTDGIHQAGAGNLGLVLTGLSLGTIIVLIQIATGVIFSYINMNYIFSNFIAVNPFYLIFKVNAVCKIPCG
ncbi:MAG: CBS domain-containing protein [Desulfobacterales bacterium]|nr:CBS domain-containing protein [Desulfobacterales bacterium]